MTPPWSGRPTASLFARLLTLIGITLVASQAIILAMIFILPPPAPDFYRLSEVAQTFKGRPPGLIERRPLELKIVDRASSPTMEGRMVPKMRA
ncbi:MAG TPA: two-component sensor histidine kinase, partial [Phenylobacterium sp.]|nr:two-component sensor histidine kinase [Phenylobacterium sp.]